MYEDIPRELNLATWFLDRRLEEGRGDPTALVCGHDAACTYAELAETADELRAFMRSRLSPHRYPRAIRVLERLPRTASGTLDRRRLRTETMKERA
jgi:acyl-coenzyme A synthetase/AMP-(fatty) acid ligase